MSMPAGVAVEKRSKYTFAHTGPRELYGRPQGGAWVRVIPDSFGATVTGIKYTTSLIRVCANIYSANDQQKL